MNKEFNPQHIQLPMRGVRFHVPTNAEIKHAIQDHVEQYFAGQSDIRIPRKKAQLTDQLLRQQIGVRDGHALLHKEGAVLNKGDYPQYLAESNRSELISSGAEFILELQQGH